MWRKYVTEGIGTFFLAYTIGCAATIGVNVFFAAAAILTAMIYAGAPVSGAHFNPAVSVAIWIRGRLAHAHLVPYMLAQFAGALAAAGAMNITVSQTILYSEILGGRFSVPHYFSPLPAMLAEFLFTFALAFIVLNVATSRRSTGNSYYGLAIGFTLLAGILSLGSLSGGAFNPAVALSLPIMGLATWPNLWIYMIGTFLGGAAAGYTFRALNPDDL